MPVTAMLGAMAAWLVPGLLLVALYWLGSALRADPARRTRQAVGVTGGTAAERKAATARLRGWGFRPKAASGDRATAGVELVPAEQSEATEFDPRPTGLAVEALDGLKFGACVPRELALDMLRTRLGDCGGAARVLVRPPDRAVKQ